MVDAREYHERTNHSRRSLAESDFSLDPSTRPRPYKRYLDRPRAEFDGVRPPQQPALSAVATARADPLHGAAQLPPESLDRGTLATLCYLAGGVTGTADREDRTHRFRAASCTGNLQHIDLYLVCGACGDLPAGVYHFDPDTFGLDVLREGEYRGALARAVEGLQGVAHAPATVVATSTWWRNAWKYRERTYRHAFWDAGTVLANLLAGAHAFDYRAAVVAGFADDDVLDLLGLDPAEEAPVALAPVGRGDPAGDPPVVDPIDPATEPYSPETVEYPLIPDAWRQSRLERGAVADWRERAAGLGERTADPGGGERVALDPVGPERASARPLWEVVRRRRSCREYADETLSRRKLGTVLDRACRGIPGDWNGGSPADTGLAFNDVFVLATGVEGVPDGSYQFHPGEAALERLGDVDPATKTRLALDQSWAGAAHVNVYCLADIEGVVGALGNRGYRLAQLEAGLTLGRLYLATYAHRDLGGTGLTFFDGAVTDHLSPRAGGRSPMTLFGFGVAAD